ncbi:MAG: hypothetical protein L3J62_01315 [Gammaproteobacteria bacterium]|nr:hypothetical protein [Gammaproteobacteria bacterium]MCF6229424.1 hypothetical protein [Gammaproteobacteria bacterium]
MGLVSLVVLLFISACSTSMGTRGDFSEDDRKVILAYFGEMAPPPTPGPGTYRTQPAKVKSVRNQPSVMNKKLARGAGFPLPKKLESMLSPLDRGLARAMVGWNVVIVDVSSRRVIDRVHAMGY